MKYRIRRYFSCLFFSLLIFFSYDIVMPSHILFAARTVVYDRSSRISVRTADTLKLKELRLDKDFRYEPVASSSGALDWLYYWLRDFLNNLGTAGDILEIIFIVSVLAFVILLLTRTRFTRLFYSSRKIPVITDGEIADIQQSGFGKLIEEEIRNQNYRYAVRYLYLELLKSLGENGLITWHSGKTNYQYYLEIKDEKFKEPFRKLSTVFDYVWYGKFEPAQTDFERWHHEFNEFRQTVKLISR